MLTMSKKKAKAPARPWHERLKTLRDSLELTQAQMAKKFGVSHRTWIAWENDQRNPSETAKRLIRILFPNV